MWEVTSSWKIAHGNLPVAEGRQWAGRAEVEMARPSQVLPSGSPWATESLDISAQDRPLLHSGPPVPFSTQAVVCSFH